MKKRFIYIILILSIMMYTLGSSSISWFMSTAASGENTFTVGTLDIGIGDGENCSGQIDLGGLAPEKVIEQKIKIANKGTLPCKIYGIEFSDGSLASLSNLGDSLNFNIYFTDREEEKITTCDIPVFYNYMNTIKDDLIIFYPIIVEAEDEITMVFRAELDLLQIGEEHSGADESMLGFEILATQIDTPLYELSERYKLLKDYTSVQNAWDKLENADVLVVGEGQYQCDQLVVINKKNISIIGENTGESIPEFMHIEEKNNEAKTSNNDGYFLTYEGCSGVIMRNIALGYYMDNKEYSIDIAGKGQKPKKPLNIIGNYNQINTSLYGDFKGNANPGHINISGRNNIIFIDEDRYNPPKS